MQQPFISLCIPAYKNASYLKRLLDSIFIQTFKDYEVIVTDDSPDNEVNKLIESYTHQIKYFKNDPTAGMPQNWNECIKKASGKWVKLMHDDDWLEGKDSLETFANAALEHPHIHFFFSNYNEVFSDKIVAHSFTEKQQSLLNGTHKNLIAENVIGHPSTVMHSRSNILYDPHFRWVVDIDFYMRFLDEHKQWLYIDDNCINIGKDKEQLSNVYYKNPKVEIPEYFDLALKHQLHLNNKYVFQAFWVLIRKFKIKSFEEIKTAGYAGSIPEGITEIINYQKLIPRLILKQTPFSNYFMMRCYKKFMASHSSFSTS